MTYEDFLELFPHDKACLAYLKDRFYSDGSTCPGCGRRTKFHRIKGRSAYSCQFCGTHVYPTAGTLFHRSTTPLQSWFWAVFLMSSTHGRISVKELERELGVAHRTAQRMASRIGSLLEDGADGSERRIDDGRLGEATRAEPSEAATSHVLPPAHSGTPRQRSIWNARRRGG